MKLTVVPQEQVAARSAARWGDFGEDETLSDLIRAEVTARGSCPRWTALRRLEQALGGDEPDQNRARLRELCDGLEYEGDLTASSGGVLNVSPVRAIELQPGVHRMVCSLPSRRLSASLPGELHVDGLRRLHRFDPKAELEVAATLQTLGGVVVSPQAWAGLDLTPVADGTWLDNLDQRLEWRPEAAGSLERDGALDWQGLTLTVDGPRWRRDLDEPRRLWRARTSYGGWLWAFGSEGRSPTASHFASLSGDEAARTVFALARVASMPIRVERVETPRGISLRPAYRLPRAEYRFLSIAARFDPANGTWVTSASAAGTVLRTLCERLGLDVVVGPSKLDEHEYSSFEARLGSASPGAPVTSSASALTPEGTLLEPLPQLRAMGPLLGSLGASVYADLLHVDLEVVRSTPGVGRKKVAKLRELILEARLRSGEVEPVSTATIESPELPPWSLDPEDPTVVLGRLQKRVHSLIERHDLRTVSRLRAWVADCDVSAEPNYGLGTHRRLVALLDRAGREGRDALVFGGPAPASIRELSDRYLTHLDRVDPSVKEVFDCRFREGLTLEAIGERRGVTRERIRQIVEVELRRDRPSWGGLATSLLEPAWQLVEQAGGVVRWNTARRELDGIEAWRLEMAIALAGESDMRVDPTRGVLTVFDPDDLRALRRDLRGTIEEWLQRGRPWSESDQVFRDLGLSWKPNDTRRIAEEWLGLSFLDDYAHLSRQSVQAVYVRALQLANGPLSAAETADAAEKLDPLLIASANNAVASFQRSSQVYSFGHGLWIHASHLPVSAEALAAVAKLCLVWIQALDGKAIGVRELIRRLGNDGSALSGYPYLLRDALIRTGKVRAWRAGLDVAWKSAESSRRPILEYLLEYARDAEQPFDLGPLVEEVAAAAGCEEGSVLTQFSSSDEFLGAGQGLYYAKSRLFASDEEFESFRAAAFDNLPEHGVVSSGQLPALLADLPEGSPVAGDVVWAVLRTHPRTRARTRGRFIWREGNGERLWQALAVVVLRSNPVLRTSTFAYLLETHFDLDSGVLAHQLLVEGASEGVIQRVGHGWYVSSTLSQEDQARVLSDSPEVVSLALGSQDFVRESASRGALNLIRESRGLFRVFA